MSTILQTTVEPASADRHMDDRLLRAWRRERAYVHLRGSARLVPWLVGIFMFDFLADWLLELPGFLRLTLLLANLGLIGWLAYRGWIRFLRPFDPTRVSLQVEGINPGLSNLLVSYVQLVPTKDSACSGQMIQAMRRQAEKTVAALDFDGIVDFRTLQKLLAVAGTVLLLFLASSAFLWEYYLVLANRMLNPFSAAAYPTRTSIEEIRARAAVKQGDPVAIEARVGGEIPEQGYLYVRVPGASWEPYPLSHKGDGQFSHGMKAVQSFSYYFQIGDAREAPREVKVVPPPQLVGKKVLLRFPEYTGLAGPRPAEHGELQLPQVPEGTSITWELRCDQALQAGQLVFAGGKAHALVPDAADPRLLRLTLDNIGTAQLAVQETADIVSLSYHFEWTEKEHGFTFVDSTRHALDVVRDKRPEVALLFPRPSLDPKHRALATPQVEMDLLFQASDDYGLDKARIKFWVGKEIKERPTVPIPVDTWKKNVRHKWDIKKDLPGLKENTELTMVIEVSDNRPKALGGGQWGASSPPLRIKIVSAEEYQQYVEKSRAELLRQVEQSGRDLVESSTGVKQATPKQK